MMSIVSAKTLSSLKTMVNVEPLPQRGKHAVCKLFSFRCNSDCVLHQYGQEESTQPRGIICIFFKQTFI